MLSFLQVEAARRDADSLRRELRVLERTEGSRISVDGKTLINFASNDYAGLLHHAQVIQAASRALDTWGSGAGSSRLISGSTALHGDVERELAAWMKKESALLFPSGYMANLGVVTALVGPGDAVIMDRLCHASLVDAVRLSGARLFVYRHSDVPDARRVFERASSYRRKLLITESLFSMDGDFAPLRDLAALCRAHQAISLVDEAHALGVWGFHGRGVLGMEGTDDHWDVVVGTLSKALGSQGGFVAGSQLLMDSLVNRARSFIFTTGLSPVCVAAAQSALRLIREDAGPRVNVQKLSTRLRDGLRAQGWNICRSESQIVPILLGSTEGALAAAAFLLDHGIYAPAIRPPTVHAGECRIRFSVTANHVQADIDQALEVTRKWKVGHE